MAAVARAGDRRRAGSVTRPAVCRMGVVPIVAKGAGVFRHRSVTFRAGAAVGAAIRTIGGVRCPVAERMRLGCNLHIAADRTDLLVVVIIDRLPHKETVMNGSCVGGFDCLCLSAGGDVCITIPGPTCERIVFRRIICLCRVARRRCGGIIIHRLLRFQHRRTVFIVEGNFVIEGFDRNGFGVRCRTALFFQRHGIIICTVGRGGHRQCAIGECYTVGGRRRVPRGILIPVDAVLILYCSKGIGFCVRGAAVSINIDGVIARNRSDGISVRHRPTGI